MKPLIFHIPHASLIVPDDAMIDIILSPDALADELRVMTDHFTDTLFLPCAQAADHVVRFAYSRLAVDVERFEDDAGEPMSACGMGAVYTLRHDGTPLRRVVRNRDHLIAKYYRPHHRRLEAATDRALKDFGYALILDCHSFPQETKPYERDPTQYRPEICIGSSAFHSPEIALTALEESYRNSGFEVQRDTPFSGTIVPLSRYLTDKRVFSVMIELRRDLYMDEETGKPNGGFDRVAKATMRAVMDLRTSLDLHFEDALQPPDCP